jgi:tRNA dimethylallyltransferase
MNSNSRIVNEQQQPPLLVIAGPTASGKSSLAMEVAEQLGGEIVSADAFAVYRGMDIGTDKPSREDRERIRHHLIDIVEPIEVYSAGAFADAARALIPEIEARGATPIVAGGTHFWIRALVIELFPSPPRDPVVGERLAAEWSADPDSVRSRLRQIDPDAARQIGENDRQRILRALEVYELTGEPLTSHWHRHRSRGRFDPLYIMPNLNRHELYAKIDARAERLFSSGLVEEVEGILASGVPHDAHALKAIGYREVVDMLRGRCDLATAVENTKRASRNLAKRQLTWIRGLRGGTVHRVAPAGEGNRTNVIDLWQQHTRGRHKQ